jgi:hypothetical protein
VGEFESAEWGGEARRGMKKDARGGDAINMVANSR